MTGAKLQDGQADLPSTESTRSYWHREPSDALLGHRSTKNLPPTADVVIVGSGITGAFAAKELLERHGGAGKKVLLLEAREVCWGATGRNGGHCQPVLYGHTSSPTDDTAVTVADFELRTYTYLRDLVAKHAIPCDWVSLRGVHALLTPDLVSQAAAAVARVPAHLRDAVSLVTDREDLQKLRVPNALGAVVQENAASCWPYKLVAWVFEDLVRRFGPESEGGGEGWFNLQTNTPVTRLQRLEKGSADEEGEASWIVHAAGGRGQVAAKQVLLACNGHTSCLLPAFSDLIVPVRGQVAALEPEPRAELGRSYVFMASSEGERPNQDDYLIQRPGPGLEMILGGGRANGTARGVGFSDDDEVDPVVARYLRRAGARNVDLSGEGAVQEAESEKELKARYEWTGIMGFSRDGRPWVGEVPGGEVLGGGEGLWVCAGYTGHGMPQAALCGRAVAGMMAGAGDDDGVQVPRDFLVGEARARAAKQKPSIKEMDDLDMFLL
ncbi:FAD dependent oxidoreductase [Colletotrichum karsti]|uniref:FAD dependent oxidoreductase n=1 Tax=Colletotrichum karsti TaxID=1095194 RepID=A0A9P6LQT1_9PEZI|nr:FAD dependent oxidoreductase [Colletotrichum karsti]KAF9882091.1 FAD dependent oxidoreductase [Colletotrichum karsti]